MRHTALHAMVTALPFCAHDAARCAYRLSPPMMTLCASASTADARLDTMLSQRREAGSMPADFRHAQCFSRVHVVICAL